MFKYAPIIEMKIVTKIGDYKASRKMDKEEVLREFYIQDKKEKEMMLEKFVFCHFSSEKDFENYFRIDELEEGELFRLISFLYHQDCFLMIMDIISRHKSRFLSHRDSFLGEISFSKRFYSRLERLNGDYMKEKQSQHESG